MTRKAECPDKVALLQKVQRAMGILMDIHNEEVTALLREDFKEIDNLRERLAGARAIKANAIDRFRDHVTSHNC